MAKAHGLDGLVLIPNCDKIVPGMVMAAARLDIPVVIVSGGPMLAGDYRGRKVSLSPDLRGRGQATSRVTSRPTTCASSRTAVCPTCGSCAGLFTANSMSCVTETLGLSLPGDATIPAPFSARLVLARQTGAAAVEVARKGWTARRFLTPRQPPQRAGRRRRSGLLHQHGAAPAWPSPTRPRSTSSWRPSTRSRPHAQPGQAVARRARNHMEDLHRAGGVMAVLKRLDEAGLVDGSVPTVVGRGHGRRSTRPLRSATRRSSGPSTGLIGPPAAWPCCSATWLHAAPWSRNRPCCREMLVHRGPGHGLRRRALPHGRPSRRTRIEPGCGRGHPLRRAQGRSGHARDAHAHLGSGRARVSMPAWRSSPTVASAAPAGGPASATWRRKRWTAVLSPWSRTAI